MSARSECSSEFLTLNVTQTLVKRFDDPPNASTGPADELITPFPPSTTNGKGAVDDDGDITDDDDKEEEEEEDEEISDAVRRASAMLCVVRTGKKTRPVMCPMTDLQKRVYKRVLQLPDFQLIARRKEPCDCGRKQKRGQCCHRGDYWLD